MMKSKKPESFLNFWMKSPKIGGAETEFLKGYNLTLLCGGMFADEGKKTVGRPEMVSGRPEA